MAADLSVLSTEDLLALKGGDLSKVSTAGLQALKGFQSGPSAAERVATDPISAGARATAGATPAELLAGSSPGRFLLEPARGLLELGSHLGLPGGESAQQTGELIKRGREAYGDKGMDIAGIAGQVASPAVLKVGKLVPAGANLLQKALGSAATGATAGALTPTEDKGDFWKEKGMQTGTGAAVGAVLPPTGALAKGLFSTVHKAFEPILPGGPEAILGRFQDKLLGPAKAKVAQALAAARELVPGSAPTAGEAVAGIPEASALAAHQQAVSKAPAVSGQFVARSGEQEGARAAAIGGITKTPADLAAVEAERARAAAENYGTIQHTLISPSSEQKIMEDAIAARRASKISAMQDQGRFQTTAAQQENLAHGGSISPSAGGSGNVSPSAYPPGVIPGGAAPRVPGRYTENIQRVPEALSAAEDAGAIAAHRAKEEGFLSSTMDLLKQTVGLSDTSLGHYLNRPSMRVAVQEAIKGAQETGSYFPRTAEDKFSIANLQRMKQALDDAVKNPEAFGIKATEAKEIMGTREAFVKWLSSRSPAWQDARLQYAADSAPINQMQVGRYLQDKLTAALPTNERAAAFAQAVRDAPGTIKRSVGGPRFQRLEDILTPEQLGAVNAVGSDLGRKAQFERLARGTNLGGAGMQPENLLPNLLSRPAMVANYVAKKLGHNLEDRVTTLAGHQYLNPAELAAALADKPISVRKRLVDEFLQRAGYPIVSGAPAAAVGSQY